MIEQGEVSKGKTAIETQMILNHKSAIELLVNNVDRIGFNRYTLLNLHSTLAENLLPDPADEGRVREHTLEIGKSVYRPLCVPALINEMLDKLLDKAQNVVDPFEQSFFVLVHLPYLQPFADVNKRVSRLAANLPLIRANLCPLTFLGVPKAAYSRAILGVYELNRIELLRDLYLWAYQQSVHAYLTIKRDLTEPDPLRLAYREALKQIVYEVVTHPQEDALSVIERNIVAKIAIQDRENIRTLVIEELRRLHPGVLARYQLHPDEFEVWQASAIFSRRPHEATAQTVPVVRPAGSDKGATSLKIALKK